MNNCQPGILAPVPQLARYLTFVQIPGADVRAALADLAGLADGNQVVVGIGRSLALALDVDIAGLHDFPARSGHGIDIPATPAALWVWLRGDDRGELLHLSRDVENALLPAFTTEQVIDAFQYQDSRDLSGYVDGTENPDGDEAVDAAVVQGQGAGLDGASFLAVQQWWHELDDFQALSEDEQDNVFGRHRVSNEEFDEAPESAHVKRTAQESFAPEAFVVRRSMPWADGMAAGLVFTAFGKSFDAFEALLNRMTGGEDGIIDGLFSFTRPVTGAYFWCPPVKNGHIDLSRLGL